jgi:hypothetical protein
VDTLHSDDATISAEALLSEVAALPARDSSPAVLLKGLHYTHEAMIDLIIANPGIHQNTLARTFGYTASWISTVMATDSFQSALAARREQVVDPLLRATLEEQARGLYLRSMEIIREKLNADAENVSDNLAMAVYKESGKLLGYGARPPTPIEHESVNEQLVKHADNLVNLLRHKRREAETIDVEAPSENSSENGQLLPPPSGALETG